MQPEINAFSARLPSSSGTIPNRRYKPGGSEYDGARAALKRLNETPGKGFGACHAALKAFGVSRLSDVPREKIDGFIKYVLAQAN